MNPLTNPAAFTSSTNYFGSNNFGMQPLGYVKLTSSFPAIPDTDLNQIAQEIRLRPRQITTGDTRGSQIIQGQQQIQDSSGVTRMVSGFSPGAF